MNEEKTLAFLGVTCDAEDLDGYENECENNYQADVVVLVEDTQEVRFSYIINLAVEEGWLAVGGAHPLTALMFCPKHKKQGLEVEQSRTR